MSDIIFDGHNDVLLRLWLAGDKDGAGYIEGGTTHIDAIKAKQGGLGGGFFAAFAPMQDAKGDALLGTAPISLAEACRATDGMLAILKSLCQNHPERIRLCRSRAEINAAMAAGTMAAVFHIEGAEALAPDLSTLDDYYSQGLRSIGPVWSRTNAFGEGVPLSFPGHPSQGGGLTDAGKALVHACNAKGLMLDLSHLNEAGFWDVAKITSKPLVATHSNSHALCASPRNLTGPQLAAIAESGGLVGVNFASGFLREDGRKTADTPIETVVAHIGFLLERLGEGGVALGSDFDGAIIPQAIGDARGLPRLIEAMRQAGFGAELIKRITHANWLDMIEVQIG